MTCQKCNENMADGPIPVCFTCIAGSAASKSSEGALEAYRKGLAALRGKKR